MFGKWNLGNNSPVGPEHRGFDEVLMHGGGGIGETPDYWNNDCFDDVFFHNGYPTQYEGYSTDVWFEEAMKFIKNNKNQPFFCYLSTNAAGNPYHIAQGYTDMYAGNDDIPNPAFYGMITNLDENLAALRQHLEALQIAEHTLLVFMSDNGTGAGVEVNERGFVREGVNYNMRGMRGSPYDGGHRVPCFFHWENGNLTGGKDISGLTAYTDLMPTLIELCNLKTDNILPFDGISLVPFFEEDTVIMPDRYLFFNTPASNTPDPWENAVVMNAQWRLIRGRELYNMARDSAQRWNVAQYYPRTMNELREAYEQWWSTLEQTLDRQVAFTVGGSPFPMTLTAYDWWTTNGPVPWDQKHIRQGIEANGYWTLDITKPGNYQFELRRWPKEISKAFNDTLPPTVRVPGSEPGYPGKSLQIDFAKIKIGEFADSTEVDPSDKFVQFITTLPKGETSVQTWLRDTSGIERGSYYLYVHYLK